MDRFTASQLRYFYGELLTERQNEMLRLRYDEDLSFGEIADVLGVSRQAVLDGINKGEKHLEKFENALGLAKRDEEVLKLIDEISARANAADIEGVEAAVKRVKTIMEE